VCEKASNSDWLVEARECVKKLSTLMGLLGKRVCEKAINSDGLVGEECMKKLATLTTEYNSDL
jgi:hypothetical protein